MKELTMNVMSRFSIAGLILAALLCAMPAHAQDAYVQFVHNFHSADHAVVDVYLNATKPASMNDLRYRRATPFIEVEAGIYEITVADPTSTNVGEGKIGTSFVNTGFLQADAYYVFVISGVHDDAGHNFEEPNDGRDIDFTILKQQVRPTRQNNAKAEFVVFHTGTDVQEFDLFTDYRTGSKAVDDLGYDEFSSYVSIDPGNYILTLTDSQDDEDIIRGFDADLNNFNDPFVVIASGFYTTDNEPEDIAADHEFGMYAVRKSGSVVPFPEIGSDVQIIHNSGFPDNRIVDVYVNDVKPDELNNLEFRKASPYVSIRSGDPFLAKLAGEESADADDAIIATFNLGELIPGQDYAVVINGLQSPGGFENGDPVNRDLALDMVAVEVNKTSASNDVVDLYGFHGVTDIPAVDIYTNLEGTPLFEDVDYGVGGDPVTVSAGVYSLSVTEFNSKIDLLGRWFADFSDLGGQSVVVFASGFMTTQNEPTIIPPSFEMKLYAALGSGEVISLPFVARMQVIHAAGDPSAGEVDIYFNGYKPQATDDFGFLGATPYMDLPAEVDLMVTFAQPSSSGPTNRVIKEFNAGQLTRYMEYAGVAIGINDPTDYENPDEANRDLNLGISISEARSAAEVDINAEFVAFHGVTDAGPIDIRQDGVGIPPVANLDYSEFSNYVSLEPNGYVLRVTEAGNEDAIIQSYDVDLSGLTGESVTIFAHGFVTPENEPAVLGEVYNFGLSMAAADGTVTPLSVAVEDAAQVQFLNNAGLVEAGEIDIYVNGKRLSGTDDLGFREATSFINVPANEMLDIVIAEGASTRSDDRVLNRRTIGPLTTDGSYYLIVNGAEEGDYENPDPGNRDIDLQFYLLDARQTATDANSFDFLTFHGSTDAPAIDVYGVLDEPAIFENIDYGMTPGFLSLPAGNYILALTEAGNINNVIGLYRARLLPAGGAALIFASGFTTLNNEPGTVPSSSIFGVYMALPDGTIVQLQEDQPEVSALQLIHNSPDPAAAEVDIYVNGVKSSDLDNIPFRGATPFLSVPAGQAINVVIAGATSTGVDSEVIMSTTLPALDSDERYVAIVTGVAGEGFNNGNEGNRDITLDINLTAVRPEAEDNPNNFEFVAFHGSTDAPDVDIKLTDDGSPFIANLAYGDFSSYNSMAPGVYDIEVTAAGDPETVAGQYFVDLSGLTGQAGVLMACGFLTPGDEPGTVPADYNLRLCLVLDDGSVLDFDVVSSVIETPTDVKAESVTVYPQPAAGSAALRYELTESGDVRVELFDQSGRPVARVFSGYQTAGVQQLPLELNSLASGVYSVRVFTQRGSFDVQVIKVR